MASTKLLQLYRNSNLYDDLAAAKSALETNAQRADGEMLIARYKDSEGNPKALVGIYNGMSGQSATITYLEGVNVSETGGDVSASVQAAIDAAVATETERAEQAESDLQSALTSAIEALGYTDSATGGQFVYSVSEANGVISVTHASIASNNKTVTVTPDESGNIDLAVNIDGTTITKDDDGKLSVASSALTQYVGANAIAISEPDTNNDKTVSLVIDESEPVLSQSTAGLKTTLGVKYDSDTKKVQLTGINGEVISDFDATEFIYDGIIKEVSLVQEDDKGNKGEFIKITFYTKPDASGEMGTEDVYLDVTDLTDVYVAGNGINIEQGTEGYVVSVNVDSESENFLSVGENGVKLSGVQDAIDAASAAATTVVALATGEAHLTLNTTVDDTTKATTYTIGSTDVASATTQSNIISAVGLGTEGTLTDDQKTAIGGDDLVTAVTNLLAEVKADETSLKISSSDKSITVTSSDEGTDVIVALETEDGDDYVADMIVKGSNGGLALNSVIDCGEY